VTILAMRHAITLVLVLVGVLHLYPALGVLSAERLRALYGIDVREPNLLILMRHRAVLFGILGIFLVASAALPVMQPAAIIAGFVSTAAFVALASSVGGSNSLLRKVVAVDVVASTLLLLAGLLRLL
jgi:hypothetical protein